MTCRLLFSTVVFLLLALPKLTFGQAPTLGTAGDFVLFSTVGAVSNTGISQLTGNVGTNSGSTTGFGNVNGTMHNNNGASAQAAADLLIAYNQLNSRVATFFPAPLLGNGQILTPGVYSIAGASTISLNLILDAQNDPNAVFIFKMQGPLSTSANAKVKLINGALACNVFWKVEGLVSMAAGTTMRGTVIANNAAITMSAGDTLEGRALSTTGAITTNGVLAYLPTGCGSLTLNGPAFPALGATACYGILSGNGPVTNAGISIISGDVGTNVGLTTGFNHLNVTGMIHPIPDGSTAAATTDLLTLNTTLNDLPFDIELLFPAQFGRNLVLTPHTYRMNAAAVLTDTLYLNARGNANAVFVIQINGALSTSTHSKVVLINGTLAKNVFWKVNGAVSINDYSVFNGTIVANNGALQINTGATINGRAFTTNGALQTAAIFVNSVNGTSTMAITGLNTSYCQGSPAVTLTGTPSGSTFTVNGVSTSFFDPTTLAVGSHTVVMSNANGSSCSGSGSVSQLVTVTAGATVPTISATATSFCAGGAATLTTSSTSGATYAWFLDGTAIPGATAAVYTANAAGNYTVTATVSGCGAATSTATSITVNATPAMPTITATNALLTSSAATGNQWYLNGIIIAGETNQTYTATSNGDYTVVVTEMGCTSATSAVATITLMGMADNLAGMSVQVYPNPASGSFNVKLNGYQEEATVVLYNLIGQKILTDTIPADGQAKNIKLNKLTAGTYLLKVTSANGFQMSRLILQ